MYDYLFLTHLPSFYKVNLYNALASRLSIYVIFVGSSSLIRERDFMGRRLLFEHSILHDGPFESRPRIETALRLLRLLPDLEFKRMIVGGWDLNEFWLAAFMSRKCRNAVAIESSVAESSTFGIRKVAKKLFLSRVSAAFPSGASQDQLLTALGFRGKRFVTGGVGIVGGRPSARAFGGSASRFLYVGRLAPEKNLHFLVEAFNELPELSLTIVGTGPLESELKATARANIAFTAHVANEKMQGIYLVHDVLVLPSLREPWGVVVEEALSNGLPVIVSSLVGSHANLIKDGDTGLIFDPHSKGSLVSAIRSIREPALYRRLREHVNALDFHKMAEEQIGMYVRASRS
jgi:hypothetical protein